MSTMLVARGLFRPDGLIELLDLAPSDRPSEPQEVEVTVISAKPAEADDPANSKVSVSRREPGGIWLDESISAPFDLPRGPGRRVKVRRGTGPYLPPDPIFPLIPDPLFLDEGESK